MFRPSTRARPVHRWRPPRCRLTLCGRYQKEHSVAVRPGQAAPAICPSGSVSCSPRLWGEEVAERRGLETSNPSWVRGRKPYALRSPLFGGGGSRLRSTGCSSCSRRSQPHSSWERAAQVAGIARRAGDVLSGAYQVSATVLAGQTIGQRALSIRVLRRDTGGVPTVSRVLLRWAITAVPDGLSLFVDRVLTSHDEQTLVALKDLEAEVNVLKQQHGQDRQELNRALMVLYQERNVNPTKGCLSVLLGILPGVLCRCVLTRQRFGGRCIRVFMTGWPMSSSYARPHERAGVVTGRTPELGGILPRHRQPSGSGACRRPPTTGLLALASTSPDSVDVLIPPPRRSPITDRGAATAADEPGNQSKPKDEANEKANACAVTFAGRRTPIECVSDK